MKLHVYSLKNRLSGVFERPFAEIYDETEYPELLSQSLAVAPVAELERHKEFDLYCVGSFDSKSGEIISNSCSFVCSLEDICVRYISVKNKEIENVREETRA